MKKRIFVLFLFFISCFLYGQQLTRIAVIDLSRIYTAFFSESRAVRDFEERSARVQNEINRQTRTINDLKVRQSEAVMQNNQNEATRLDTQIYNQTQALNNYYQAQTAILEDMKRQLMQPGTFYNQVYDEVRYTAESEGYTTVFNLNDNSGIFWYSTTVDITDKVIQNLRTRR